MNTPQTFIQSDKPRTPVRNGLSTRSPDLRRWLCTLLPALTALMALPLLVACGGGAPAGGSVSPSSRETPLTIAAFSTARSAALDTDLDDRFVAQVNALFDWAQRQQPSLFPGTPATQRLSYRGPAFLVRDYGATGHYLGVSPGSDYTTAQERSKATWCGGQAAIRKWPASAPRASCEGSGRARWWSPRAPTRSRHH